MIQIDLVTSQSPPAINSPGKPPGAMPKADKARNDFKEVLKNTESKIDRNEKAAALMAGEPVSALPVEESQNKGENKSANTDGAENVLSDNLSAEEKSAEKEEDSISTDASAEASVQCMTEELVSSMMTVVVPSVPVIENDGDSREFEGTNTGIDSIAASTATATETETETENTRAIDTSSNQRIVNDAEPMTTPKEVSRSQIAAEPAMQLDLSKESVPGSEVSNAAVENDQSSQMISEPVEVNLKADISAVYGKQETGRTMQQNAVTETPNAGVVGTVPARNDDVQIQTGAGQSCDVDATFSSTTQQTVDVKAASQTGSNPISLKQESNPPVSQTLLSEEQITRIDDIDQSVLKNGLNASAVKPGNGLETQVTNSPRITTAHLKQIAQEVNLSLQTGKSFTRIQLHPQDLGVIDIKLSHDANGIGITIMTEQSSTGRLLEGQMENLRQSLADAGLNLTHLNFGMKEQTPEGERQFLQDNQMAANHSKYRKLWSGDEQNQKIEIPQLLSLGISMVDYRV